MTNQRSIRIIGKKTKYSVYQIPIIYTYQFLRKWTPDEIERVTGGRHLSDLQKHFTDTLGWADGIDAWLEELIEGMIEANLVHWDYTDYETFGCWEEVLKEDCGPWKKGQLVYKTLEEGPNKCICL